FLEGLLFLWLLMNLGNRFMRVFFAAVYIFLYPGGYFAEIGWITKRYTSGGPRLPKTAMVTSFPTCTVGISGASFWICLQTTIRESVMLAGECEGGFKMPHG